MTPGTLLKSSYYTRWPNVPPYVVKSVSGPCTCPSYLDTLNRTRRGADGNWITVEPPASRPHYHLVVKCPGGGEGYLNGYAPAGPRWESVWGLGYLWQVDEAGEPVHPVQQELFA